MLCKINQEILKTSNKFKSFLTNVPIVNEDLMRVFYRLFYLQFCKSSSQWKNPVYKRFYQQLERYFYMKIIVTMISTDLITNSFLASFCPSLQTRSKNQVFNKLVVWYREIVLFLVYSESRSTLKPCWIQCLNVEYLTFKESSYMLFFPLFVFLKQVHLSPQILLANQ